MNIDQARQSIYMALCDYTETSLAGDDNAAVRSEIDEAWNVLLEHIVPARYGVYRYDLDDRFLERESPPILVGFASASDAMDAANAMKRVNPGYRYTVGQV